MTVWWGWSWLVPAIMGLVIGFVGSRVGWSLALTLIVNMLAVAAWLTWPKG